MWAGLFFLGVCIVSALVLEPWTEPKWGPSLDDKTLSLLPALGTQRVAYSTNKQHIGVLDELKAIVEVDLASFKVIRKVRTCLRSETVYGIQYLDDNHVVLLLADGILIVDFAGTVRRKILDCSPWSFAVAKQANRVYFG